MLTSVTFQAYVSSESEEQIVLCGQHHITLQKLNNVATMPAVAKVTPKFVVFFVPPNSW